MTMIDIGKKDITLREAVVGGEVLLKPEVVNLVKENKIPKGNVLEAAKIAGILAAKKTPAIIPLCHPIPIEHADIKFSLEENRIKIETTMKARSRTGVEMEAFTATAVAALTIYDMCKSRDRAATISEIKLLKKSGGKSGDYGRD